MAPSSPVSTPAKIGASEGVGGELGKNATAYHQITLPPGKWKISLGLTRPDGQNSNVMGQIDLLDAYGCWISADSPRWRAYMSRVQ